MIRSIVRRTVLVSLLACGLGILPARSASATSLTIEQVQTHHFDDLNSSTILLFNGFDASLGALSDVHLSMVLDETLNDTALVFPPGSGAQFMGVPTPATATATTLAIGPAGLSLSDSLTTPGFVGPVPDDLTVHIIGSASIAAHSTSTTVFGTPISLAAYIGGVDAVSIALASSGTQGGSVPPKVLTGNNGNADVSLKLFYSYEPATSAVPEPGTLGLVGFGMLGLAIAARRGRTTKKV